MAFVDVFGYNALIHGERREMIIAKPTKLYVHQAGFDRGHAGMDSAKRHALDTLTRNYNLFADTDYLIAVLWRDTSHTDPVRVLEVFGYGGITKWPGNPDKYCWVFHDSVYVPEKTLISCGDTDIVLGREEEFRRTTPDLETFMRVSGPVDDLIQGSPPQY